MRKYVTVKQSLLQPDSALKQLSISFTEEEMIAANVSAGLPEISPSSALRIVEEGARKHQVR